MVTKMIEEKPLFIEKKLTRWERPGSPKPGTAFVFIGEGIGTKTIGEGECGPTHGEVLFGKYTSYYEVDMGERLLSFQEELPSRDLFEFKADVKIIYAVKDPLVIVQRSRIDAGLFLQEKAIDVMRSISRKYKYDQIGDAEEEITEELKKCITDEGFKLIKNAFVRLSLDESVISLLKQKQLNSIKLDIKQERAKKIASLIQSGNWQMLLAMFDPNDPADEYLRQILATMSEQRGHIEAARNKLLEVALEKGAVEGDELTTLAKYLIQEKTGLSDKAIALISEKTGVVSEEEKTEVPEEVSRNKPT